MRLTLRSTTRVTLGVVCFIALVAVGPASADEAEASTVVEAWYRGRIAPELDPVCAAVPSPVPCLAEEPEAVPWPPDTLHVGVTRGRVAARTFFQLGIVLPGGAKLQAGTVMLPVADAQAGTLQPERAVLTACRAQGDMQAVQGGAPSLAPGFDCSTSVLLTYSEDVAAFIFDLEPFFVDAGSASHLALAIVPAAQEWTTDDTWRIVFHGRDRSTPDATPITAKLHYVDESGDGSASVGSAPPSPQSSPVLPGPSHAQAPLMEPAPPIIASPTEPARRPAVAPAPHSMAAPSSLAGPGYAFPQVWLLPLAFLATGALLARGLVAEYRWEAVP